MSLYQTHAAFVEIHFYECLICFVDYVSAFGRYSMHWWQTEIILKQNMIQTTLLILWCYCFGRDIVVVNIQHLLPMVLEMTVSSHNEEIDKKFLLRCWVYLLFVYIVVVRVCEMYCAKVSSVACLID